MKTSVQFYGKQLSNYSAINASQHKTFLASLGCFKHNAVTWVSQLLENKTFSNIHGFQLVKNAAKRDFRVIREIPIQPVNFENYNLDLLSYRFISNYKFNKKLQKYKKQAQAVTGFIHNNRYSSNDIETMEKPVPGTYHWGGDAVTLNKFITKVARKGLKLPPEYVIKPIQVLPLYGDISDECQDSLRRIHKALNLDPMAPIREKDVKNLNENPSYKDQLRADFGLLPPIVNKNSKKFLDQI